MAFHEVRFPVEISYNSSGGPTRRTEVVMLDSGFEQRNTSWSQSLHKYNVSYGLKTYDLLHLLKTFWEARNGKLHGFRFKDWSDFKSVPPQQLVSYADQILGTADGTTTQFQLVKTYTSATGSYVRIIKKPVSGTVRVSKNGVEVLSGWTVNTITGLITFAIAPTAGQVIAAGFEFDVPVRFENDSLEINLAAFQYGEVPDIIIKEIRV